MARSILVTGAAGFAGSHLVDLLAGGATRGDPRNDVQIVAWRRPGGRPLRELNHVRWDAVDLLDQAAVTAALRTHRPDVVYHCAGAPHVGRAFDTIASTLAVNVRATHRLLEGLREAALSPILLLPSSAMVYRPSNDAIAEDGELLPANPYGFTKLAQEQLAIRARADGIDVRVARPFNHIGPRQDPTFAASGFARQIAEIEAGRRAPEIVVGNLAARRDLTDVRDTVRAYRAIVERGAPGCCYNVSTGCAPSVQEVLDRLVAEAHVPVRIRVDPALFRPQDTKVVVGDPARIRRELGWRATIPLEQSLRDVLEYWRGEIQ